MLLAVTTRTSSFAQFLIVLLLFFVVILLTYGTLRIIGRIQKGQSAGSNIEVIETRAVANGKYLEIVRAGKRYFLIAVGKDEIHTVSELSEEEIEMRSPGETDSLSFASVFDRIKNIKNKDED